jgi:hypothetical protein
MVLRLDLWVFVVDGLGTAVDVVGAAGAVITGVTMSDIVTVSVNDLMTRDTVTVKVVVCSLVISAVEARPSDGEPELQVSTSLHTPVSHGLCEQQPTKGPTAHL